MTDGALNEKVEINNNLLKKNEEIKLYYEYEVETLKKKVLELEFELEESRGKLIGMAAELNMLANENALKT